MESKTDSSTVEVVCQVPVDPEGLVDLRSDTVSKPSLTMRRALCEAKVGDDVWGDDRTVLKLQALAAKILGKEDALFCCSGSQCNLIAGMIHCPQRGSEAIIGDKSHMCIYEQGSLSSLGGIHTRQVRNGTDGTFDLEELAAAFRPHEPPYNDHFPVTRLVCLENTHNRCGGVVLSKQYVDEVCKIAHERKAMVHMDGARLMNAVSALAKDGKVTAEGAASLVENCDSVSLCLSKGLGAPVGSILAGTKDFIAQAKRLRKALGGGWRQAGILAACGVLALTDMLDTIPKSHERAARLAKSLTGPSMPFRLSSPVATNMVFLEWDKHTDENVDNTVSRLAGVLAEKQVLVCPVGPRIMRLVTHPGVGDAQVDIAVREIPLAYQAIVGK